MKFRTLLLALLICFQITSFGQDTLIIKSEHLPVTDTVLVFKPITYTSGSNLPVIFMLHGWDGTYNQWNTSVGLDIYANDYNMIMVCPDGLHHSWYANSPVDSGMQYQDFFFEELVPTIKEIYSVDSTNFFITGLSMGGYGAISLAMKKPGIFKAAGSTSGVLDIVKFGNKWNMDEIFGDFSTKRANYEKHSPYYMLDTLTDFSTPMIVDCGTSDIVYKVNEAFSEKAKKLGLPITFISQPGNHSHEYWRMSVIDHFDFFLKHVNR